jgi:hypothetical protein
MKSNSLMLMFCIFAVLLGLSSQSNNVDSIGLYQIKVNNNKVCFYFFNLDSFFATFAFYQTIRGTPK